MLNRKISEICNDQDCLGCALCQSICNVNAISISESSGFYRPVINDKCVGCMMCVDNCPANSFEVIKELKKTTQLPTYAAWSKNEEVHRKSTSGGTAYAISKKMIEEGGFVVGVWFNPNCQQAEHRIYDSVQELRLMQGSKYVHSNKTGIYRKVLEQLKERQGVFIGVPCEVYAMKCYFEKFKKQGMQELFYIDLLCRGGASPLCFSQHLKKLSLKKIDNVSFRGGDYDCRLSLWRKNVLTYQDGQFSDPYFRLFMRHTLLQPACFSCKFAGGERIGDLTLGDFWGLDRTIESQSEIQGINMVFVNNGKGNILLSKVRNDFELIRRNASEAIAGNETLQYPTPKEKEYDELWLEIRKTNFHKAIKKIYGIDWKERYLKSKIKLIIKQILGKI